MAEAAIVPPGMTAAGSAFPARTLRYAKFLPLTVLPFIARERNTTRGYRDLVAEH
jgi:hypothetical protein